MASSKTGSNGQAPEENACIVCYKGVEIYSIGQCDHPVCFECSARMRVLCLQNECPICRQDMPTVIFTETIRPYSEPKENSLLTDKKFKIVFDSEKVQKAYQTLLAHNCPKCDGKTFQTFGQLREHVRRVHQLNFCDLCVENLKILTRERRCYTRQELGVHRRQGDPDDRSHRGHPLCQFCDTRFMDNDELYRHLRRNHLYCHFCDADGYDHYYSTYDFLREHFRNEHFLCEEGECYDEKFTAVFRTEIDLKAHRATVHGRAIGKAGVKQARTLELEFTLAPRPRISRSNRPVVREEEQDMGAVGGSVEEMGMCGTQLKTDCMEEFPSLSGGGGSMSLPPTSQSSKVTATIRSSARGFTINDENFPALGPEATLSLHVNSESRPTRSSGGVSSKPPNVSIQVNHRPSGFTTRVSSSHFEHNFPALSASTGKGSSAPVVNIASTQWSSGKKPDTKVSVVKQKAESSGHKQSSSSRPRTFRMDDDFPSLGTSNNKSSTPGAAPAPPPNLPNPPAPPAVNAQSSDSDAVPPPVTATRSKKKKSKSKNNPNTNSNNNNSNNINNNSTESKKNKSNTAEDGGGGGGGGKSKKKSKEPNAKQQISSEADLDKSKKSFTDAMTSTPSSVNASAAINHNNNNDTGGGDNASTSPSEKRKDEAKKKSGRAAPVFSEEEFPSFSRSRPPGFSDLVRVPPGFDAKWPLDSSAGKQRAPPPPGFAAAPVQQTNGGAPPPPLFPPLVDTGYTYVPPSGFVKRNKSLVSAIKSLGSPELNDLQDMSVSFRCGLVTAQQYFDHCQHSMATHFDELFPELLVLLPDIEKQRELWPFYQQRVAETAAKEGSGGGGGGGKKNSKSLECCATCYQVVRSSDLREHRTSHALETQFPVLNGRSANAANNAWQQPIAK